MTSADQTTTTSIEKMEVENKQPTFPEGGYGWAVSIGGGIVMFVTFGHINAFGVYQTYYTTVMFPNSKESVISLIGAFQVFFLFLFGLFAGKMIGKFGPRLVTLVGSIIFVFALFMNGLCHEIWQLFLAQGVLFGVGCSLPFYPAVSLPSQYFFKRRSFATAIVVAGSSLGGVVLPIVIQKLLHKIGYQKTLFTIACISAALLFIANLLLKPRFPPKNPARLVDYKAFKSIPFLLLVLGLALLFLGIFTPFFYIEVYSIHIGIDKDISFYTISIVNAASLFGRIIPGFVSDYTGRFNMFCFSSLVSGVIVLALWLNAHSLATVIIFAILYGFFSGSCISLIPPAIAQITADPHDIPSRTGLLFFCLATPGLVGTPISGALLSNYHGNFTPLIVFTGVMFLAGTVVLLILKVYLNRKIWAKV